MDKDPQVVRSALSQVAEPWDKLRGDHYDIFLHEERLMSEISNSASIHLGPNCGTFSRVREIPIPGVKYPPVPLRDDDHPRGRPFLDQPR